MGRFSVLVIAFVVGFYSCVWASGARKANHCNRVLVQSYLDQNSRLNKEGWDLLLQDLADGHFLNFKSREFKELVPKVSEYLTKIKSSNEKLFVSKVDKLVLVILAAELPLKRAGLVAARYHSDIIATFKEPGAIIRETLNIAHSLKNLSEADFQTQYKSLAHLFTMHLLMNKHELLISESLKQSFDKVQFTANIRNGDLITEHALITYGNATSTKSGLYKETLFFNFYVKEEKQARYLRDLTDRLQSLAVFRLLKVLRSLEIESETLYAMLNTVDVQIKVVAERDLYSVLRGDKSKMVLRSPHFKNPN